MPCRSHAPTLALLLLCACSGTQDDPMDTQEGDTQVDDTAGDPGLRGYDETCSTLTLTSIGGMELPWRASIALGHQDCASPDLVVFCDADGPLVESGEVEVLACSDQGIELRATPDQVCVDWQGEGTFCRGREWGEPVYRVVGRAGDLDCVAGDFTVQACD